MYTWPGGERYEGGWKDDARHGKGIHIWPDGLRYEGDHRLGMKDGFGVLTSPDGKRSLPHHSSQSYSSRYVGEFKDDLKHGVSVVYDSLGTREFRIYRDDVPVSSSTG